MARIQARPGATAVTSPPGRPATTSSSVTAATLGASEVQRCTSPGARSCLCSLVRSVSGCAMQQELVGLDVERLDELVHRNRILGRFLHAPGFKHIQNSLHLRAKTFHKWSRPLEVVRDV